MSRHPFELRYNDDGQILAKLYPHQSGRVAYVYDQSGKLDTVLAGKFLNLFKTKCFINPAYTKILVYM